ncbi:ABC transporter ATP-binding protein [Corynebacterium sp. 13CS0277]|uniref:metal ABC transporter ATP-binding protein n=1 Tax=Corynebacterium sp. 13CS0277 TaxID=2071994 RepID=UPI000D02C01B|nr:metal ABC transporter ATP-binding protein [Corynebacterium sp. 13CS0277]PRQ11511.1 ABC transporter ATP-binding protein [Corynebacterium sp. 13CS0277]
MTALHADGATLHPLWSDVSLTVAPGEFVAVLGPNGVGKSTFLRAALGLVPLDSGRITTAPRVGFIPQQRMFDPDLPLRVRDLVGLSLAHRALSRPDRATVDGLLAQVGAAEFANTRVGALSGGQQQLVRQAQALACDPQLILADEPLLSLDYLMQSRIVDLLDARRRACGTAVVFVTHSINPILRVADTVLYLGPRGHTAGPIEDVMTSETLSELYGTHVDVVRIGDRLVVV